MSSNTPTAQQLAALIQQRDYAWASLRENPGGANGVAYANLLAVNAQLEQKIVDQAEEIDALKIALNECMSG